MVLEGGRIERQQPDAIHAELLDVVELGKQSRKIPVPVTVAIAKALDVRLIDYGVLVPQRILGRGDLAG